MNTLENTIEVAVEATGIEEITDKMQNLSDAIGAFPANVIIRGCRDCKINIYPSQTMIYEKSGKEEEHDRTTTL